MPRANVLFLCTGNSARSQMAEAYLRHHGGDLFEAFSAGIEPRPINPLTIAVMQECGISLEGQYSKSVREYLGKKLFGYLITVCADAEAKCPTVWPGVQFRLHWTFEDPAAFDGSDKAKLAKFREVRDQIELQITTWTTQQREKIGARATAR